MDNEQFLNICNNQQKWANEYRKQQSIRKEIRKIINRKQIGRGGLEIKANILIDLKSSLYINEITIVENPSSNDFDIRFFGEHHTLPALNKPLNKTE